MNLHFHVNTQLKVSIRPSESSGLAFACAAVPYGMSEPRELCLSDDCNFRMAVKCVRRARGAVLKRTA